MAPTMLSDAHGRANRAGRRGERRSRGPRARRAPRTAGALARGGGPTRYAAGARPRARTAGALPLRGLSDPWTLPRSLAGRGFGRPPRAHRVSRERTDALRRWVCGGLHVRAGAARELEIFPPVSGRGGP